MFEIQNEKYKSGQNNLRDRNTLVYSKLNDDLKENSKFLPMEASISKDSSLNPLNPFTSNEPQAYPPIQIGGPESQKMPPLSNVSSLFKWTVSQVQENLIRFERRQFVLVIVFVAIFLDNMLLTTVGMQLLLENLTM